MKVGIFGTGYVGLVTGVGLADVGHQVVCRDIDERKLAKLLKGESPIYEPGLDALLEKNIEDGRITFTSDAEEAVAGMDAVIIGVGTPPADDGSTDMSIFLRAAEEVIALAADGLVIVDKSTVPVGTAQKVEAIAKKAGKRVHVVSNPETLREGNAISDFMSPDRVIIGARSEEAFRAMRELYSPFMIREGGRILEMSPESAELVKYGANTLLAQRISFINFISQLCTATGADVRDVRRGIGMDHRIGMQFLYPGPGFGGSCFPKDVSSLAFQARSFGVEPLLPDATLEVNRQQKRHIARLVEDALGDGTTIAVWGLAFKARTDDVRESSSITLAKELLARGKRVLVHDPEASENFCALVPEAVPFERRKEMLREADVLVVMTEWDEYRTLSQEELALLEGKTVVDGRNILARDPELAKLRSAGIRYVGVGIPEQAL